MKSYFFKLTIICTWISLLIIFYSSFRDVIHTNVIMTSGKIVPNAGILRKSIEENPRKVDAGLKYILQWTSDSNIPFKHMGKGRAGFVDRKCPYTNCFVTSNRTYLDDYTKFDVVAFSVPELSYWRHYRTKLPKRRSLHQKYVFASIESPANYPMCNNYYNSIFNWTWTYKLDSEVRWGYIVVKDLQNNVIGPRKDMNWLKPDEMTPVTEYSREQLKTKTKAAAWFASNCFTVSRREDFVSTLQKELKFYTCMNSSCNIDIYGTCGPFECSRDHEKQCDIKVATDYYFYLSFENSFSEDYVTEKLLRALNNNAVPIVYGGANYSRFMPDGAYLDARKLGVKNLAAKMYTLMNDEEEYAKYFRWKNHYSYHRTLDVFETNEYCRICALLNDEQSMREVSVYDNITEWWNDPETCTDQEAAL